MTPEQHDKHLRTIERIENLPRPAKWREIRKFVFELHPAFKEDDKQLMQICKEMRQASKSRVGASQQGDLRHLVKLPPFLYQALITLDKDFTLEQSGRNRGHQLLIGEQLWKAFPEYRIAGAL